MDDASDMFRLAIGVFFDAERLESAVADLRADGITPGQLCLAGTREAVDGLAVALPRPPGAGLTVLTGHLLGSAPPDDLELVATDGRLVHALLEYARPEEACLAQASTWRLADLLAGLASHFREGAVALLVCAPDVGAQRRSSRVLLRHSAHTVQTHEFVLRRP